MLQTNYSLSYFSFCGIPLIYRLLLGKVSSHHMASFVPGQRWISDTETEQGLGTILSLDGRMVTLLFPATGEMRTYSSNNSPLTRVQFNPGDKVESHEGWVMTVTEVTDKAGILTYHGRLGDGQIRELAESCLGNFIRFNKPQDRMLAGQIDQNSNFSLRYKTLQHNYRLCKSPVRGLIGPRTTLTPHQLHIAREVALRHAPRVMLADEVGMGKTIEAGMILHQQLISGRTKRALIVVPESLQHQWLVEMLRRFNLHFSLFDEQRCEQLTEDNPFNSEQLVLCSLNFLCQNEERLQQALAVNWDLMIVDEAHHLIWSETNPSAEYQCIEQLAKKTPGLLLLTATPEQMGVESHFARLHLLDPDRFHDLTAFEQEERSYEPVAMAVQELLEHTVLTEQAKQDLSRFLGADFLPLLNELEAGSVEAKKAAQAQLLRQLLDRHGTGRVLFRNTRATIDGFPGRVVQGYPQALPELYQIALDEEAESPVNPHSNLYPEQAYQAHIKLDDMDPWWKVDPRADWLIHLIKLLKKQKVLVICANATTALDLADALRILSGIPTAVFHEGMSIVERDRAAAWFADDVDGAQTMVCSEIGSEGRNFQFAHHLVLFDLPEHPDLLEQRIGRLDRIGQTETIRIHVPYIEGTAQEVLFHWYQTSLNAFADTCPTGSAVYHELGDELAPLLKVGANASLTDYQPLLEQARTHNETLRLHLHNGRDRLLELNSRGLSSNEEVISAIEEQEEPRQLKRYMEKLFESFGVETEDHSKNCLIVRPGSHMVSAFPMLPEEGTTVTFNREMALSREEMQFLTWEHPMVSDSMETILSSDMGNTAVALLKNKALKPGTMLLEAIYVVETSGEKALQLARYLPATPIRSLIDPSLNDLAGKVAFDTLNAQLQPIKKGVAKKLVKAQREPILTMLSRAEESAKKAVQPIVSEACQNLLKDVTEEIKRLAALKAVNPNVRDEEIEHLKLRAAQGHQCLQKAMLRLDALRLMVAG